jgi:hypothetical protein
MESNIVKKYLELKGKLQVKDTVVAPTPVTKKKTKANEQFIVPEAGGTINDIINKKPKLKYVVSYLQARVDELNQIEMDG